MPAFGKPINPASAINFSLSQIHFSSPTRPALAFLGAWLFGPLKWLFPKPPFPPSRIMMLCLTSLKSAITVLLSSSNIIVPFGTLIIISCPFAPVFSLPFPSSPFLALKCCLNLKSINVFKPSIHSIITFPPLPPLPPLGPPNSIYFSRRKLTHPFPPLPELIKSFDWSRQ